jgi:hypothetical protein
MAVDVEVGAVRREAEGDAGEAVDDEARGRRVIRKVAMNVVDSLGGHQPRRMRHFREDG